MNNAHFHLSSRSLCCQFYSVLQNEVLESDTEEDDNDLDPPSHYHHPLWIQCVRMTGVSEGTDHYESSGSKSENRSRGGNWSENRQMQIKPYNTSTFSLPHN